MPDQFAPTRITPFTDPRQEARVRKIESFLQEFTATDPEGAFGPDAGFGNSELDTGDEGGAKQDQNRRPPRNKGQGSGRRRHHAADAELETDIVPAYQQTYDGWYKDNPAGTAGPTEMVRSGTGAYSNQAVVLRPGWLTGVIVKGNDSRTAGTLTVTAYVNGVATGLTAVLDGTNVSQNVTFAGPGVYPVASGDFLSLYWETVGFTPTTMDFVGCIEVSGAGGD